MKLIKNEVNKKANREREKEKKERKKPHSKLKTNQPYLETLKQPLIYEAWLAGVNKEFAHTVINSLNC